MIKVNIDGAVIPRNKDADKPSGKCSFDINTAQKK